MSEDDISEQFSFDIFRRLWHYNKLLPFLVPYQKDCGHPKFGDNFYQKIVEAICIRALFFKYKLSEVIKGSYDSFSKTNIDFFMFFIHNFDKVLPSKTLQIYEKLFLSCGFVFEMGRACAEKGNKIFLYSAPLSWALYFDLQMKHDFDLINGWGELEQYAERYRYSKAFYKRALSKSLIWSDDLRNCQELFEQMKEDYEFSLLIEVFNQKCTEKRNKMCCSQCEPLFMTLNKIANPCFNLIKKTLLIEGYLQLFLKMNFEELKLIYEEAFMEIKRKTDEQGNLGNASDSEAEKISAKKEKKSIQEQDKSMITMYRIKAVQNIIQLTFFSSQSFESSMKNDFLVCIFCGGKNFRIVKSSLHDGIADDDINLLFTMILEAKELKTGDQDLSEIYQEIEERNRYGAISNIRNNSSIVEKGESSFDVADKLVKLKLSLPLNQNCHHFHQDVEPQVENQNLITDLNNLSSNESKNSFNETWKTNFTNQPVIVKVKTIPENQDPEISVQHISTENQSFPLAICNIPVDEEKCINKYTQKTTESTKVTIKTKSKKKKKN